MALSALPSPYHIGKTHTSSVRGPEREKGDLSDSNVGIEDAEVSMSLVVPAFNEENRLGIMLKEAVGYLQKEYGKDNSRVTANGSLRYRPKGAQEQNGHINMAKRSAGQVPTGWEVLIVSDGSTDKTIDTALEFARSCRDRNLQPQSGSSPWSRIEERRSRHAWHETRPRRIRSLC